MATAALIDTDMGIDDAVAVSLALASKTLSVKGLVAVGGNVPVDEVVVNIGRLLRAVNPPVRPVAARGLDGPASGVGDRRDIHGEDGLGQGYLSADETAQPMDFRTVYRETAAAAKGELAVVCLGPLTNLAAMLEADRELARSIKQVFVSGGAVWTKGNVSDTAEYNFRRDPQAAARVLSSGLPITVVPLDVTGMIRLDESHVARLAASGSRTGEVLAEIMRYSLERDDAPGPGKTFIQDAVTMGGVLWPDLFLRTRMRLDVETQGPQIGRCKPALGGDRPLQVNILTVVNAVDLIENMLESLCHEEFVV
jgi:inosine-uridine nucleoside N-ribohydrolase